jgi:hypothetical protein
MYRRLIEVALFLGLGTMTTGTLSAQQPQPSSPQPPIMDGNQDTQTPAQLAKPKRQQTAAPAFVYDPDVDAADQLAPSQMMQPMPGAVEQPSHGGHVRAVGRGADAISEPRAAGRLSRTTMSYVVACGGVFGRDSSHAKLAIAFHSGNVTFRQVDTASGGKAMASVVFAKDPKRRIEVWWSKPSTRSDTHLIVINGASGWTAPGDLRLGLTLAELEQVNGKPFRLSGFDKSNLATLTDWNGGALASPPGGCKVGISLHAALTASASTINALPVDREFNSANAALLAVNPVVSEILVAY